MPSMIFTEIQMWIYLYIPNEQARGDRRKKKTPREKKSRKEPDSKENQPMQLYIITLLHQYTTKSNSSKYAGMMFGIRLIVFIKKVLKLFFGDVIFRVSLWDSPHIECTQSSRASFNRFMSEWRTGKHCTFTALQNCWFWNWNCGDVLSSKYLKDAMKIQ